MKSFSLCYLFIVAFTLPLYAQTVGVLHNTPTSFDGYTLVVPLKGETTYLINNCGETINSWISNYPTPAGCYLLENGDFIRNGKINNNAFSGGGTLGGIIERFNWNGDIEWTFTYSNDLVKQHHDIEVLPNGNILLLAWERKTAEEAKACGRNPALLDDYLWVEHIVEIEPFGDSGGNIVWEWHLWDHVAQDYDNTRPNFYDISSHPELIDLNYVGNLNSFTDWNHCNSIDYNPELDQIVLSSRTFSEFWIIDHSTTTAESSSHTGGNSNKGGDILYRWGNPQTYQRGNPTDQKLFGQHDVQWIEKGKINEGKILVFNNGLGRTPAYSSFDIIDPPVDVNGNYQLDNILPYAPMEPFWTYSTPTQTDFFSSNISGIHALSNGNIIGVRGQGGYVIEVNPAGDLVWEFLLPISNITGLPIDQGSNNSTASLFRIRKYPKNYKAFECKNLSIGPPIESNPIDYGCQIYPYDHQTNFEIDNNCIAQSSEIINNTLTIEGALDQYNLSILDLEGNLVFNICKLGTFATINLADFESGVYILRIENIDNNQIFYEKMILNN